MEGNSGIVRFSGPRELFASADHHVEKALYVTPYIQAQPLLSDYNGLSGRTPIPYCTREILIIEIRFLIINNLYLWPETPKTAIWWYALHVCKISEKMHRAIWKYSNLTKLTLGQKSLQQQHC